MGRDKTQPEPATGEAPSPAKGLIDRAAASLAARGILDPDLAPQVVVTVAAELEMFSGPLPPPHVLASYDEIGIGNGSRIIAMAESEQKHRHRRELLELVYPYLGLVLGFLGFVACVGGAVHLATHDAPTIAGLLVGASALGAIGWFVKSRLAPAPPSPTVPPRPPASGGKRRR